MMLLLVLAVFLGGCIALQKTVDTPRKRWALAAQTYAATMRTLTDLREAGRLSQEEIDAVDRWYPVATEALQEWKTAIQNGESTAETIRRFEKALARLMEIERRHDGHDGDSDADESDTPSDPALQPGDQEGPGRRAKGRGEAYLEGGGRGRQCRMGSRRRGRRLTAGLISAGTAQSSPRGETETVLAARGLVAVPAPSHPHREVRVLDIEIDDNDLPEKLRRLAESIQAPKRALRDFGGHWQRRVKKSMPDLPKGEHAEKGEPPGVHTSSYVHTIIYEVSGDGSRIELGSSDVRARILHEGGTIKPRRAQALAVPVAVKAHGKRPRDFPDLEYLPPDRQEEPEDMGLLIQPEGDDDFTPMYALRAKVTINPHPHIEIVAEDVEALGEALEGQFDREMEVS